MVFIFIKWIHTQNSTFTIRIFRDARWMHLIFVTTASASTLIILFLSHIKLIYNETHVKELTKNGSINIYGVSPYFIPLIRGITNQCCSENMHKCTGDHYLAGPYNIKLPDCLPASDLFVLDSACTTTFRPFKGSKLNTTIEYWSQIRPLVVHLPEGPKQPSTARQSERRLERNREYSQREEVKQRQREYRQREEVKEYHRQYNKQYYRSKKQ